ncbi:MAG: hypothetical protein ACRDJN_13730 [Chloroflexota bacterium]
MTPERGAAAEPVHLPDAPDQGSYVGVKRPDEAVDLPPPPGQMPVIMAALSIGVLLMGIQLWLLTVALELLMAGEGSHAWQLALASGAIFLGGLLILWLLHRRPSGPPRVGPLPEPAGRLGLGRRTVARR